MSRWSDASVWTGDGLRREVFFFPSGGELLYGSLFASAEPSRPFGVVVCNSWGVEADRCDPLQRAIALAMARLGGAGMVFHCPGYGDSHGDLAGVGLADLAEAAADAVAEASRRCPGLTWILAGIALGASVAVLARRRAGSSQLLLIQPEFCPGTYFRRLAGGRRRLASGPASLGMRKAGADSGMAYGYPVPRRIAGSPEAADRTVACAVADFAGDATVVRHAKPAPAGPTLDRFPLVSVPGAWRFGSRNNPRLAVAAIEWLDLRTRDEAGR